ncbi:hypothetical protein LX36DRAFT_460393 [Colletotrichum falcatum]|nr:hypothetical protein LX36DRAFT_460393 [Colletotrichum falcatum]
MPCLIKPSRHPRAPTTPLPFRPPPPPPPSLLLSGPSSLRGCSFATRPPSPRLNQTRPCC